MRGCACRIWLGMAIGVIGLSLASPAGSQKYHGPLDPAVSPAAQSVVDGAPAGPSIRIVLAGSTAASMKALTDWCNLGRRTLNPGSFIDPFDPRHFQEALNAVLMPTFRSIQ